MLEPTITCTNCQSIIPLTETLARPYIEAEREKMQRESRERAAAFDRREKELQQRAQQVDQQRERVQQEAANVETAIEERLNRERQAIATAAVSKAENNFKAQLDNAHHENEIQAAKIAELESAELEYRTKRIALEDEKRRLELEVTRKLDEGREQIRNQVIEEQQRVHERALDIKDREVSDLSAKLSLAQQAELTVREERQALELEKQAFELQIARTLDDEREVIRAQAIEEQHGSHQRDLQARDQALAEARAKLQEAQQAELAIRQERQALEDEKQALELEVARKLDQERNSIREATRKEDDEQHRMKLADKDKVIDDMRKQIDELRRKSEQGSQQLQGEVQELELEAILRLAFPKDLIESVPVGRAGSDVLHRVIGLNGLVCGTILWESKRTKNWSDLWLAKNRDDQRTVGAHLGVIVSATLPDDIVGFDRKDGVWVVGFSYAAALGRTLRQLLIETALARVSGEDREGKSNRVYSYVTGQDFRQRVGAIVDAYITLRQEIETEKRSHKTRWARQERSLDLLLDGAGRLYGDLQGIVGKSMPEIEGLEAPQIEASANSVEALSASVCQGN